MILRTMNGSVWPMRPSDRPTEKSHMANLSRLPRAPQGYCESGSSRNSTQSGHGDELVCDEPGNADEGQDQHRSFAPVEVEDQARDCHGANTTHRDEQRIDEVRQCRAA